MRVYVSPSGIGLGHIARTTPIVEELISRGAQAVFSTYLDGLTYAAARGFKLVDSVPIGFRVQSDGTVDFKQTAARSGLSLGLRRFLKQVRVEIRNMKVFKPDVVFSDSRASSIVAARLLGIPVVLMLNQFRVEIVRKPSATGKQSLMDRLFFFEANIFWIFVRTIIGGVWAQSKLILIPDFPYPDTISLENLAIPSRYRSKVRFLGPVVNISPRDLPARDAIIKELSLAAGLPIVYAAVSGPRVERQYLVKVILDLFQTVPEGYGFVMSCGNPKGSTAPNIMKNVVSYEWVDDKTHFKLLKAADVVISRSGHGIVTRTVAFGKPLILIPTPDHTEQYGNAKRAVKLGVAAMLDQRALNHESLLRCLTTILNSSEYRRRAESLGSLALKLDPVNTAAELIERVARQSACAKSYAD
jgi:UDP-N-acetylglucosamine--N-acetylmuramyl-(pentapeptide) pyrophosphoryl-undecaprenol N-acetylglucosamine transferase